MKIEGGKELSELLKTLPQELTHQLLGSAYAAAAKPLIEREKQLAPVGLTHNLVNSIGSERTSLKKADALGETVVGPRRRGKYKGFAGHLNEKGTKPRKTRRGANRGIMPAKPFVEPAFNQTKNQVISSIPVFVGKRLISKIKRTLKK